MAMTEQQARHRVRQLRSFYSQVAWFVAINLLLVAINLLSSPNSLWFFWVTIFWGFALVIQAVTIYTHLHLFGKDWEEKKIAKLTRGNKS